MVRGALLWVVVAAMGARVAVVWVAVVFGLVMHGLDSSGIFITMLAWTFTVAVLRTRSLWAGYLAHQVSDVVGALWR